MKSIILKKFVLYIASVFLISSSLVLAQSNEGAISTEGDSVEDLSKVVDYIDNNTGTLILNDFIYKMKLNTKVYDQQKKVTNRYALRRGQRVIIEVSKQGSEGPGRLIDSIFILDK